VSPCTRPSWPAWTTPAAQHTVRHCTRRPTRARPISPATSAESSPTPGTPRPCARPSPAPAGPRSSAASSPACSRPSCPSSPPSCWHASPRPPAAAQPPSSPTTRAEPCSRPPGPGSSWTGPTPPTWDARDRTAAHILAAYGPTELTGRPVHALQLADGRAFTLRHIDGRPTWTPTGPRALIGTEDRPELAQELADDATRRAQACTCLHRAPDGPPCPIGGHPSPDAAEDGPQEQPARPDVAAWDAVRARQATRGTTGPQEPSELAQEAPQEAPDAVRWMTSDGRTWQAPAGTPWPPLDGTPPAPWQSEDRPQESPQDVDTGHDGPSTPGTGPQAGTRDPGRPAAVPCSVTPPGPELAGRLAAALVEIGTAAALQPPAGAPAGTLPQLFGVPVVLDATLPPDTVRLQAGRPQEATDGPRLMPARSVCSRWQEERGGRLVRSCDCAGRHCPDDPRRGAQRPPSGQDGPQVDELAERVRDAGTWDRNTYARRVEAATILRSEPLHAFTDDVHLSDGPQGPGLYRIAHTLPVSRAQLIDAGLAQPTPAEVAQEAQQAALWRARRRRHAMRALRRRARAARAGHPLPGTVRTDSED
jgi:hypothetical protein